MRVYYLQRQQIVESLKLRFYVVKLLTLDYGVLDQQRQAKTFIGPSAKIILT